MTQRLHKYRMESWYFLIEEGVEDPPIFYDEGDGNGVKKHESIFDFWEVEVEYKEKIFTERREIEKQRREKGKE